jgi:hypothetical protein
MVGLLETKFMSSSEMLQDVHNEVEQGVLGFSNTVSKVPESLLLIMKNNTRTMELLTKTRIC